MNIIELNELRFDSLAPHFGNIYQPANLTILAVGTADNAGMANTSFDENICNDLFRKSCLDFAKATGLKTLPQPNLFCDGYLALPINGALALAHPRQDESSGLRGLGEWAIDPSGRF